jgi:hypothetical protein
VSRPAFTPAQLAARPPVWLALADLFLDSDARPDLPRLALTLASSGYDELELSGIWQGELTPPLHTNLKVVAGVWGAWDEAWLFAELEARGPAPPGSDLKHRARVGGTEAHFQTVLSLRRELLALPEADWEAQTALRTWVAQVYFWPHSFGQAPQPRVQGLWELFLALEPYFRPLLVKGEREQDHRDHVRSMIGVIV